VEFGIKFPKGGQPYSKLPFWIKLVTLELMEYMQGVDWLIELTRLSKLIELIELISSGDVSWLLFQKFHSEDFFVGRNGDNKYLKEVGSWQLAIDSRK
jgi:hypothetical protein